jgi:phosphatidate phosphatase APP1
MVIRGTLLRFAFRVEQKFDTARYRLRRRLRRIAPVEIVPYPGFGSHREAHLIGRLLEAKDIRPARDVDSSWQNLRMMYRRFTSAKIPWAAMRARFAGVELDFETDHEGYFDIRLPVCGPLPEGRLWHEVDVELLDEIVPGQGPVRATGQVQVPSDRAAFGIISDIDDTVIHTGATNFLKMIRTTFLNNAHTRVPFEGVGDFYRALRDGPGGRGPNPVFYVSSSPWNLIDLLIGFLEAHDIPAGTLMLRDFGLEEDRFILSSHNEHKMEQIERIFSAYPDLPFVLIGDSGQEDPEIYLEAVQRFGTRIRAIYIRQVGSGRREDRAFAAAEKSAALGVEMILVADSAAAARHAVEVGLMDAV